MSQVDENIDSDQVFDELNSVSSAITIRNSHLINNRPPPNIEVPDCLSCPGVVTRLQYISSISSTNGENSFIQTQGVVQSSNMSSTQDQDHCYANNADVQNNPVSTAVPSSIISTPTQALIFSTVASGQTAISVSGTSPSPLAILNGSESTVETPNHTGTEEDRNQISQGSGIITPPSRAISTAHTTNNSVALNNLSGGQSSQSNTFSLVPCNLFQLFSQPSNTVAIPLRGPSQLNTTPAVVGGPFPDNCITTVSTRPQTPLGQQGQVTSQVLNNVQAGTSHSINCQTVTNMAPRLPGQIINMDSGSAPKNSAPYKVVQTKKINFNPAPSRLLLPQKDQPMDLSKSPKDVAITNEDDRSAQFALQGHSLSSVFTTPSNASPAPTRTLDIFRIVNPDFDNELPAVSGSSKVALDPTASSSKTKQLPKRTNTKDSYNNKKAKKRNSLGQQQQLDKDSSPLLIQPPSNKQQQQLKTQLIKDISDMSARDFSLCEFEGPTNPFGMFDDSGGTTDEVKFIRAYNSHIIPPSTASVKDKEIDRLQNRVNQLLTDKNGLVGELKETRMARDEAQGSAKSLRTDLNRLYTETNWLRDQNNEYRNKLDKAAVLQDAVFSLKVKLHQTEAENQSLKVANKQLAQDIDSLLEFYSKKKKHKERPKKQRIKLKNIGNSHLSGTNVDRYDVVSDALGENTANGERKPTGNTGKREDNLDPFFPENLLLLSDNDSETHPAILCFRQDSASPTPSSSGPAAKKITTISLPPTTIATVHPPLPKLTINSSLGENETDDDEQEDSYFSDADTSLDTDFDDDDENGPASSGNQRSQGHGNQYQSSSDNSNDGNHDNTRSNGGRGTSSSQGGRRQQTNSPDCQNILCDKWHDQTCDVFPIVDDEFFNLGTCHCALTSTGCNPCSKNEPREKSSLNSTFAQVSSQLTDAVYANKLSNTFSTENTTAIKQIQVLNLPTSKSNIDTTADNIRLNLANDLSFQTVRSKTKGKTLPMDWPLSNGENEKKGFVLHSLRDHVDTRSCTLLQIKTKHKSKSPKSLKSKLEKKHKRHKSFSKYYWEPSVKRLRICSPNSRRKSMY